jgi:hypothetical protein
MPFTKILNRAYFVILPQFADDTMKKKYSSFEESTMEEFNSHNADYLSQENLNSILKNEKWLWS